MTLPTTKGAALRLLRSMERDLLADTSEADRHFVSASSAASQVSAGPEKLSPEASLSPSSDFMSLMAAMSKGDNGLISRFFALDLAGIQLRWERYSEPDLTGFCLRLRTGSPRGTTKEQNSSVPRKRHSYAGISLAHVNTPANNGSVPKGTAAVNIATETSGATQCLDTTPTPTVPADSDGGIKSESGAKTVAMFESPNQDAPAASSQSITSSIEHDLHSSASVVGNLHCLSTSLARELSVQQSMRQLEEVEARHVKVVQRRKIPAEAGDDDRLPPPLMEEEMEEDDKEENEVVKKKEEEEEGERKEELVEEAVTEKEEAEGGEESVTTEEKEAIEKAEEEDEEEDEEEEFFETTTGNISDTAHKSDSDSDEFLSLSSGDEFLPITTAPVPSRFRHTNILARSWSATDRNIRGVSPSPSSRSSFESLEEEDEEEEEEEEGEGEGEEEGEEERVGLVEVADQGEGCRNTKFTFSPLDNDEESKKLDEIDAGGVSVSEQERSSLPLQDSSPFGHPKGISVLESENVVLVGSEEHGLRLDRIDSGTLSGSGGDDRRDSSPKRSPAPSSSSSSSVAGLELDMVLVGPPRGRSLKDAGAQVQVPTSPAETQTASLPHSQTETQTVHPPLQDSPTQTDAPPMTDAVSTATNTAPRPESRDVACGTVLSGPELQEVVVLFEKLATAEVAAKTATRLLNEERSQRMVAEQLVKIVQSDLSIVQQGNAAEVTERMRLETELSSVKADLVLALCQVEEKEVRITELEESIQGTAVMVRKLEEQNSVSLMNRGGMDYMLQAKLADHRALEAEQKLEIIQAELLQSQNEVRRLLERVGNTTRERSEMVSNRVHNQLLQIADEKAVAAERRAQELEREILLLKQTQAIGSSRSSKFPSLDTHTSSLHTSTPFSSSSSSSFPKYPGLSLPYSSVSSSLKLTDPLFSSSLSSSIEPSPYSGLGGTVSSSLELTDPQFSSPLSSSIEPSPYSGLGGGLGDETASPLTASLYVASLYDQVRFTSSTDPPSSAATKDRGDPPSSTAMKGRGSAVSFAMDTPPRSGHENPTASSAGLPSFEALTTPRPKVAPKPASLRTSRPAANETDDDDDSASWPSSDEEEEAIPLQPSTHANLTAQWEWRARQGDREESPPSPTKPTSHSPFTARKKPPPIAPKPKLLSGLHQDETLPEETAVSFQEPKRAPSLRVKTRPRGPKGRNLPSRPKDKNVTISLALV